MALPQSIRLLAALTLCIFFYMMLQLFRAPEDLQMPGHTPKKDPIAQKYQQWDHDPQLDRMFFLYIQFSWLDYWPRTDTIAR